MNDNEKKQIAIQDCMQLLLIGINQKDKDCVRSYAEQLNDLIVNWLEQ